PRIIVGRKGTGKTAVLDFYSGIFRHLDIPSLVLKPLDIDLSGLRGITSVGEATRYAYEQLLAAIAAQLGTNLGWLVDEKAKPLLEAAIAVGARRKDIVEKTLELLPRLAKAVGKEDLAKLLPAGQPASVQRLREAVEVNVQQSGQGFYLFLDDTDQVAAPDQAGHLNRIWAFILAARELAE